VDTDAPALFRRFPRLRGPIPWLPLGRFPTPVEPLRLAGAADVWVKRDDLSGEPYGGNKVRKLEFVLARARRRGAERLVTGGAAGSHHALATTVYGVALGFRVTLVLFPQPPTRHVRDVLLHDVAHGAEIRWVRRMELVPAAMGLARFAHRSERPCGVAPGGSDPFGALGYVSAALELAEQVAAGEAPAPRAVHVAAGTLGTAAGLALGFALAGLPVRVVATRIISPLVANPWLLRRLVRRTARLLADAGLGEVPVAEALAGLELRGGQVGRGYGHATGAGERATRRLSAAGLALDPTYTAKAAAALLEGIEREREGPVLFWQTLSARDPTPAAGLPPVSALPEKVRRWVEANCPA
jgi:D-cysteine desulfhydrase